MSFVSNSTRPLTGDWRANREHFRQMTDKVKRGYTGLSPTQQVWAKEELEQFQQTYGPRIIGAALEQFHNSADEFIRLQRAVDVARVREIAEWDPSKLAPEQQVWSLRVDTAVYSLEDPVGEISSIWNEAKESGDRYKVRAAVDALKSVEHKATTAGKPLEVKTHLNSIVKDAQRHLAELRSNAEIEAAHEKAKAAFDQAEAARRELINTDSVMSLQITDGVSYRPSSIEVMRALSRFKENDRGQLVVLPKD